MATIPSSENVQLKSINGGRSVSGYSTKDAGSTFDHLSDVLQKEADHQTAYQVTTAQTDFIARQTEFESRAEKDQDHGTLEQRYNEDLKEHIAKTAKGISIPSVKQAFMDEQNARLKEGGLRIRKLAFGKEKDIQRADTSTRLNAMKQAMISGKIDFNTGSKAIDNLLGSAVDNEYYSHQEKQQISKAFKDDVSVSKISMMAPEDRIAELGKDYAKNLPANVVSELLSQARQDKKKQDTYALADSWMSGSISEGMEKAKQIKDPDLRKAAEDRFRSLKGVETAEKNRIESEANEAGLTQLVDGKPLSEVDTSNMSAQGKINAKRIEDQRIKDLEYLQTEKEKEQYQNIGKRVLSGGQLDTDSDEYNSLPLEYQKAIKTISNSNEKTTQDELYGAYSVMIEAGTRYSDIDLKNALSKLTPAQRSNLTAIDRRINPVVKPTVRKDDLTAVFAVEELILADKYEEAKQYLTDNPLSFGENGTTWKKYLSQANEAIKNPEKRKDIKAFLTPKQKINNLLKVELDKGSDKDVATQYGFVSSAYSDWYEGFQKTSKGNRLPTTEESNTKIGELVVAAKKQDYIFGIKSGESIIDEQSEYQDNLQKNEIKKLEEAGKAEIVEIQTLNGVRRARGKSRLTAEDMKVWRSEGKEAALRNVYIKDTVKATGLSETLIRRQVGQESRFKRGAKSYTGVRGLHQITRATAEQYGFNPDRVRSADPEDEEYQWEAYSAIMTDMKSKMKTDKGALLAYNAGVGNARLMLAGKKPKAIYHKGKVVKTSDQVYKEALNYVKKIMRK